MLSRKNTPLPGNGKITYYKLCRVYIFVDPVPRNSAPGQFKPVDKLNKLEQFQSSIIERELFFQVTFFDSLQHYFTGFSLLSPAGEWENACNELQRMLVVRSLRP